MYTIKVSIDYTHTPQTSRLAGPCCAVYCAASRFCPVQEQVQPDASGLHTLKPEINKHSSDDNADKHITRRPHTPPLQSRHNRALQPLCVCSACPALRFCMPGCSTCLPSELPHLPTAPAMTSPHRSAAQPPTHITNCFGQFQQPRNQPGTQHPCARRS